MAKTTLFKNIWLKTALVLMASCLPIFSLTAQEDNEFEQLMEQAKEAQGNQNYSEALKLYLEWEMLAEKNNDYQWLWYIKNNKGNIYTRLSSYGEALGNYNEALTIIGNHPDIAPKKVVVLTNIGLLYSESEEPEKALSVYQRAYALVNENSPSYIKFVKVVLAVNMADIYNKVNQPEKALTILMKVKEEKEEAYASEEIRQGWQINYAEALFLEGETVRAEGIMEGLLPETAAQKEVTCYLCVLELLSRIYEAQGKLDLAISNTKKGLETQQSLGDKAKLYNQLSHLYEQQGKHRLALAYKDSMVFAKDSLAKKINRQLLATNKVKFGIQEYQNELKINNEKRKRDRIIFIVAGLLALVVFYSIYKSQRNRITKQRQKREIAEKQQKITQLELKQEKNEHLLLEKKMTELENKSKLEKEQLKNKISQKNRMLSANALYHTDRNELLEKIISSLSNVSTFSERKHIKNYVKELKGYMSTDADWKDFTHHFEEVNPGFLKNLTEKFPNLTKKDLRFLCYLYMNLGTKDICNILNISPEAVWKRKQRIAKKMGMTADKLYDFLLHLGEE